MSDAVKESLYRRGVNKIKAKPKTRTGAAVATVGVIGAAGYYAHRKRKQRRARASSREIQFRTL